MNGYIKLHRQFTEWGWYDDPIVSRVFIHCLLMANHRDTTWHETTIRKGQFIASIGSVSRALNISIQQVRTALNKLEKTGEITKKSTNKYTVITVEKWAFYQGEDVEGNKQLTNNQQTTNNQVTINQQQRKNDKNDKNNTNSANSDISELFDRLWKLYPNKRGRSQISDKTKRTIYAIGEEHMVRAIDRYRKGLEAEPWRKAQNGSTFFNSGYVDYLDENYEEIKPQPQEKTGKSNVYVPEPPKYQKFEKEEWENKKGESMPESMRNKIRGMFGGVT